MFENLKEIIKWISIKLENYKPLDANEANAKYTTSYNNKVEKEMQAYKKELNKHKKNIYKEIRHACKNGSNSIIYEISLHKEHKKESEIIIKSSVINDLNKLGYEVSHVLYNYSNPRIIMEIFWDK